MRLKSSCSVLLQLVVGEVPEVGEVPLEMVEAEEEDDVEVARAGGRGGSAC